MMYSTMQDRADEANAEAIDDMLTQARRLAAAAVWWARSGHAGTMGCEQLDDELPLPPIRGATNAERINNAADDIADLLLARVPHWTEDDMAEAAEIVDYCDPDPWQDIITPTWAGIRDGWQYGANTDDLSRTYNW